MKRLLFLMCILVIPLQGYTIEKTSYYYVVRSTAYPIYKENNNFFIYMTSNRGTYKKYLPEKIKKQIKNKK